jgi:trk system potassium uptake protein TrkA
MTLRELGVQEIIAKAVTSIHGKVLKNLGVTKVIYPERDAAIRLAHSLIAPNILEHLELSPGYSIIEIPVPTKLAGKRLKESQVRSLFDVNIIAIKKQISRLIKGEERIEEVVNFNPSADDTLHKEDILVVIGKEENLERLSTLQ